MVKDMLDEGLVDLLKQCFGLRRDDEIRELPEGLLFNAEILDLELVVPRLWHVGTNHDLISPGKLFADTKGRITTAIGCGLECCNYGFLIGRYDSLSRQFYTLEAVAPGEEWNTSHILVYSRWDRVAGACGLKATYVKDKINHLYFHEAYDDEPYRQSGVQTLILKVEDYSILKRLVEQTLKNWRNAIAYADKFMDEFVRDREKYAKEIFTAMEPLLKVDEFPDVAELAIIPDEDETILRILHSDGTVGRLGYYHDVLCAKCCVDDMKAIMSNPELVMVEDDESGTVEPEIEENETEAEEAGELKYVPHCYACDVG